MDRSGPARKRRKRLLWLLLPVVLGLVWCGARAVGYAANHRVYVVPSGSMAPAILPGDRVLVELRDAPPARGEIWLVQGPTSALVKRVIGRPGETIEVRDDRVWIDGEPLDEPYLIAPTGGTMPPLRLGPDQYFLMGDTRGISLDSRTFGPVQAGKLFGRVEYRCWPSNRLGAIR